MRFEVPLSFFAKSRFIGLLCAGGLSLASMPARAAVYSYVDWTAADVAHGTASGTITLPDDSTVTVTFEAINEDGSPGTLYGAQVDGLGTNYWNPSAPYISTQVENAPPDTDILQLSGGQNQVYKVTLSEPIKDPIMAIVSLGQPSVLCTYNFDSPFTIVSQGPGYWPGGSDTALEAQPNNVLAGHEGHGTIQFIGTFSTFSWTVPTPETWHGFTFGIRTTERLEPDTGTGGAGGAGGDGAAGSAEVSVGGAPIDGNSAGLGGEGISLPVGGETSSGGASGGKGSLGGSRANSGGEGGEGGTGDERTVTKEDAGCNCSVPGGSPGMSLGAVAAFALATALRRVRRSASATRTHRR